MLSNGGEGSGLSVSKLIIYATKFRCKHNKSKYAVEKCTLYIAHTELTLTNRHCL